MAKSKDIKGKRSKNGAHVRPGPGPQPSKLHKLVERGGRRYWMKARTKRATWSRWAAGLAKHLGMNGSQLAVRLMLEAAKKSGYKAEPPEGLPARSDFYSGVAGR